MHVLSASCVHSLYRSHPQSIHRVVKRRDIHTGTVPRQIMTILCDMYNENSQEVLWDSKVRGLVKPKRIREILTKDVMLNRFF